ncbi:MAG: hypothetical protein IIZ09_13810, partial [Ruminococcus sp.]|nr:hypothetical protein [Ruminococcus sp.]
EISYALAFSGDRSWVTVLTEESTDTRKEASELAKNLGLQVLSAELVDSDFAELTLYEKSGAAVDTMFLGEPYFEEYPEPSPLKWQTLLGIDWAKVEEIQSKDRTFAEEALSEFGEVIGCENMLLEFDGADDDAVRLYFKKAGEKKLTLNAAFKKYFGEILEPLGFVYKSIGKRQYYFRLMNNEILQLFTYSIMPSCKVGFKLLDLKYYITPLYRKSIPNIDPKQNYYGIGKLTDLLDECNEKNQGLIKRMISIRNEFWGSTIPDCDKMTEDETKASLEKHSGRFDLYFAPDYLDCIELSREYVDALIVPIFESNKTLDQCIEYYYNNHFYNIESIELEDFKEKSNCYNVSLMPIVAGYNKDITKYVEKVIEQEKQKLINKITFKNYGEDAERLRNKLMEEFKERMYKMLAVHDKILNTPELKERALQMAEEFRQNNLEVLRSYGIEI